MAIITKTQFLTSDAGASAKAQLQGMVNSAAFYTEDAYDNTVGSAQPFVDRHINYLVKHPYVSPVSYISNLKIMTRARR